MYKESYVVRNLNERILCLLWLSVWRLQEQRNWHDNSFPFFIKYWLDFLFKKWILSLSRGQRRRRRKTIMLCSDRYCIYYYRGKYRLEGPQACPLVLLAKVGWRQGRAFWIKDGKKWGRRKFEYAAEERRWAFRQNFVFGEYHYYQIL
jgi:hypothetical protein